MSSATSATPAIYAALFFTVALLVTTAYFLMGSLPLLVLKHDTSVDARFIRSFFNTYYLAAMFTAAGTSLSYAFVGKFAFAAGALAIAVLAAGLRATVIPEMDRLRAQIGVDQAGAIPGFRRTHFTAIVINFIQLVVVVWSLTKISL